MHHGKEAGDSAKSSCRSVLTDVDGLVAFMGSRAGLEHMQTHMQSIGRHA